MESQPQTARTTGSLGEGKVCLDHPTSKPLYGSIEALRQGFPKIRGTFLVVPIIRLIVFWGLYWCPLVLGNCQAASCLL